jgi:hypothetical protein
MITARNIPTIQAWMKRKRKIALNKSKQEAENQKRGVVIGKQTKKKWRKRKEAMSGLTKRRNGDRCGQSKDMSAHKAARRDGTSFLRARFPGSRRLGIPMVVPGKYVAWLDRLLTIKRGTRLG